jgi:hypothetical protein
MVKLLSARTAIKLIILLFIMWVFLDLAVTRESSLKEFDPRFVSRLETEMWRSYYDRKPLDLFFQLSELLRKQYHLSFWKSQYASYEATRAAFIFKKGHSRKDYEKALPYLLNYYSAIRNAGDVPFDLKNTAKLELEWWIVHREHKRHPPADLDNALAALQSEIYKMPMEVFSEHARFRAEAMLLRDNLAEKGDVSDRNWQRINELLDASWQSLWLALHEGKKIPNAA